MSKPPEGTNGPRSAATQLIGLVGYPVDHSLSPAMHNAAFQECGLDYRYELLPTPPENFSRRIVNCLEEGFVGWNVTVPHKERILPYLHQRSDAVEATGACNTVRVEGRTLVGFNTDPTGFTAGLEEAGDIPSGAKAVLLGAGGAARAVAWALARIGCEVIILSRRREQAESLAAALRPSCPSPIIHRELTGAALTEELQTASLLVNCTPAGMWPHAEQSPLPEGTRLAPHLLVYDLVYRPRPTRLLSEAGAIGCRTQDGLAMLVHQGAAAFELWTGRQAPTSVMRQACLHATDAIPNEKQVNST
ncbi:MAG: shikimate dehydrogenase [Chloroflexia bacterium]